MNWEHAKAFLWLRWRLLANQWRRAGAFNAVVMTVLVVASLVTAIPLCIGCFTLGQYLIPKATPAQLMYAWDGLLAAFLMFWGVGLLTELQRTESLALSKFLHLPVAPTGAFLINYASSLLRLSIIVFVPMMLGFALALVFVKGAGMLLVLPLTAAFLFMITALTYQFQGWLASLMSDPRRRRTVVVMATAGFILVFQLPNLLNFIGPWHSKRQRQRSAALSTELAKLNRAAQAREIDVNELDRRREKALEEHRRVVAEEDRQALEQLERWVRVANMALPVGWLPLGVLLAAEGRVLPSLLGLAGMTLIGSVSIGRAYRTTVGQYQGRPTSRKPPPTPAPAAAAAAAPRATVAAATGATMLEARIPWVSEPVSAVALAGLRSLLRAPEAKMMLLTPMITTVIFGSMIWQQRGSIPGPFRPQIALGSMVFVLLGMLQIAGNQFGFDRDGFRVFVLGAARRRDVLLGKNLSFAPLALGMAAIQLAIVQAVLPMRFDHLLAMAPLYVSMFLMFCLFTNLLSILSPLPIPTGSLKPSSIKASTVLLHTVMFLFLFPLTQAPAFVPLGVEALLRLVGWSAAVPFGLLLAVLECAGAVALYLMLLELEGNMLQAREQKILEAVTNRAS